MKRSGVILFIIAVLVGDPAVPNAGAADSPKAGSPLNLIPGARAGLDDTPLIPAPKKPVQEPIAQVTPGPLGPMLLVGNPDTFQVPDTSIIGPTGPVKFGKIISIKVKPIETRPPSLFSVTYVWRLHPTPDDLIVLGDNTQALFGSGTDPATVNVELIACYLFIDKDVSGKPLVAQRVVVVDRDVIINGGAPIPPPPPGPAPGPTPPTPTPVVIPDTALGLAKSAYSWLTQVDRPDSATKKKEAADLARSFRGIAKTVTSNVDYEAPDGTQYRLDDPGKLLLATKRSNNAAIPQSAVAWTPWFISLDTKLKELKAAGKLTSVQDYAAAWNELGVALEAASK